MQGGAQADTVDRRNDLDNPAATDAVASSTGATPSTTIAALSEALAGVLSCSREVIDLAITTFVAGGHLLLEDVPGVGKTTLARAMSIAIGGESRRIQFTPDLLPSDLTGVSVYSQGTGRFDFHPGPLFANIVIADEVNRANPKAQSAMLEAMGERQISVDGSTHELPDPYFVVATQNPIELEGTYPLPEAQLDRFMACTSFGYPSAAAESAMLTGSHMLRPLEGLAQVCSTDDVLAIRHAAEQVTVSAAVADYIVTLVSATRTMDGVKYGASPRGSLHLAAMSRARAIAAGRSFVTPDDVQALAVPVLAHRLVLDNAGYGFSSMERARRLVADLVGTVAVPRPDRL
ncbi:MULTISPECIES: AAA family ATPase [Bifidobacterium]|uniref:AAA family ATPase n=1 Tax=Bifidobacterium TaxID=1678 RepID=UPI001BDCBABD|nr:MULTISPECIES: MoxR family ATPase [Bifidobacterium]MBT1160548.1 MoxR family ATPase [Bifidobacterium sp. SO1]MBW3078569.1 MoxR family ATPase [Bifidobacterium simiiventris]